MTVAKRDFVEAIGMARTRATLRRTSPAHFEPDVTLVACGGGLSIRSSFAGMDIDGEGHWPSPIMTHGATMRNLAPKLSGPTVTIRFDGTQLFLNDTRITAREV